jgi:serine/threonine protein kinase
MTATTAQADLTRTVGDEPLPGYKLVEPLGRGGFGEVWKCIAPGGLPKAVKFVRAEAVSRPNVLDSLKQEFEAFQRVKSIRHPFLLTLERVELLGPELIMVMELADQSLAQRYQEYRRAGLAGIPRAELLSYMVDAAEALDVLALEHGLQHLDVKPANLFLVGGHVKVGDYGMVSRHVRSVGAENRRLNQGYTPQYVSPEVLDGEVDSRTDQYALALLYQELLTGVFPYRGPTAADLVEQHRNAKPDISSLPVSDRATILRALAKRPADRFPNCLHFVRELLNTQRTMAESRPLPRYGVNTFPAQPADAITQTYPTLDAVAETSAVVTQRINLTPKPANLLGPLCSLTLPSRQVDDLARVCPGFVQVAELETGARGRLVKATDTAGNPVRVHLIRLEGGVAAEIETILETLAAPQERIWQTVLSGQPHRVGFSRPDTTTTLKDWLKAERQRGKQTWDLTSAVALIEDLAGALDDYQTRTGFAHGLVGENTILVSENGLGLTDYGVGELLRLSTASTDWHGADPYLAPEVVAGRPDPASDQYSLTLVLLQLMGAWTPQSRSDRERTLRINWDRMSESVRGAIRIALHSNPAQRHPSCRDFLAALRPNPADGVILDEIRLIEPIAALTQIGASRGKLILPDQFAQLAYQAALPGNDQPESGGKPLKLTDGRVSIRFPVAWTPGLSELKTASFKDQYRYTVIPLSSNTTLLKPGMNGEKGDPIELVVRWPVQTKAGIAEVSVIGRWAGVLDPFRGVPLVSAMLEQFRRVVQNTEDRRKAPRVRSRFTMELYPVGDDLQVGRPIPARCQDISTTGFSAILSAEIPGHAFVRILDVPAIETYTILARKVWSNLYTSESIYTGWRFVHAADGR